VDQTPEFHFVHISDVVNDLIGFVVKDYIRDR
jgi:hypothetical protein